MNQVSPNPLLASYLNQIGRVASLGDLQALVGDFEEVLTTHGCSIQPGSQLEKACLSVIEVLAKHQQPELRTGQEDFRAIFGEVLGIWSLLKLVVLYQNHPSFEQFVPHLALLNEGTVVQNTRLYVSDEASNKIFELIFALILLNVGSDLILDHPSLAKGDNPDILVTIDGLRWGLAFKTVYSQSPKTFFDNLRKGVQQIENSEAKIGCVVINFRNLIDHRLFIPIMNPEEHAAGAKPDFGVYEDARVLSNLIGGAVKQKEIEVRQQIGDENISKLFAGMKALPGFAAFFQTCALRSTFAGPVPSDICSLGIAPFTDWKEHKQVFDRINLALHQRPAAPLQNSRG